MHRRLDCNTKQFLHTLHSTTQTSSHHDSHFEVLTNATPFYPAMLEAIRGAQTSINMECYIFRPDARSSTTTKSTSRYETRKCRRG